MTKVTAIIVAAGEGRRFGSAKQFALLRDRPVLEHSLAQFETHPAVDDIILVLTEEAGGREYRKRFGKIVAVAGGGARRQDSVGRGFERLDCGPGDIVLVHDGVRPLIGHEVIDRVIAKARECGAAVPVIPVEDTIKETAEGTVVRTLERRNLSRVQTPQGFTREVLERGLRKAREDGYYGTDEAALVERTGHPVAVVAGDVRNVKVTSPADLKIAEAFLED
ncbi:MAG: 2-C-methyl-D-erythritol 4-phosphate cytidylyltransferase [Candidatus Aminicenantes bacterium]|nr:2-C-methyl-D-erythritol 4-phosphate cytidylyltransferase [Candidatus Aminicenantes bacterium]